jgi:hypothetical protein
MTTSSIVDKALRLHVNPVLRKHAFDKIGPRKAWAWRESCILVFEIRTVGRYFSDVTDWPPGSICVWLGAYYPFIPAAGNIKTDDEGRPLPAEVACHMRAHLSCRLDQSARTKVLPNPKERERRNIWWIEPDGANAEAVAVDIAGALKDEGIPRFERWSELRLVLTDIEQENDCYVKFLRAYHIARAVGDANLAERYRELLLAEAKRIGQDPGLGEA